MSVSMLDDAGIEFDDVIVIDKASLFDEPIVIDESIVTSDVFTKI